MNDGDPNDEKPVVSQRRGWDAHLVEHMSVRWLPGSKPGSHGDAAAHGWRSLLIAFVEWALIIGGVILARVVLTLLDVL